MANDQGQHVRVQWAGIDDLAVERGGDDRSCRRRDVQALGGGARSAGLGGGQDPARGRQQQAPNGRGEGSQLFRPGRIGLGRGQRLGLLFGETGAGARQERLVALIGGGIGAFDHFVEIGRVRLCGRARGFVGIRQHLADQLGPMRDDFREVLAVFWERVAGAGQFGFLCRDPGAQ